MSDDRAMELQQDEFPTREQLTEREKTEGLQRVAKLMVQRDTLQHRLDELAADRRRISDAFSVERSRTVELRSSLEGKQLTIRELEQLVVEKQEELDRRGERIQQLEAQLEMLRQDRIIRSWNEGDADLESMQDATITELKDRVTRLEDTVRIHERMLNPLLRPRRPTMDTGPL